MFRRSFLPIALSLPLLAPDDDGGGNPDDQKDKPEEVTFDDKQQAKVNALLAAERKRTEEATATRLKTEREEADRTAQAEAERKKQAEAGQFDEVKRSIETERDGFKTRAETAEAEREKLAEYVKSDIATVTKTVKDAKDSPAAKVLMRYYPGDDADPLALLDWAQNAKASLPEIEKETALPGNGPNPKPAGTAIDTEADKRARAAMRPRL